MSAPAELAVAYEARSARDRLRQAANDLERARRLLAGDAELLTHAAAAVEAVDQALIKVGELRHRLASRAMLDAYRAR